MILLEDAVRKMTSLPANRLRLHDRWRISSGLAADIVVFDAEKIQDTATFTKPLSYSVDVQHVLVDGQLVIEDGRPTEAMPGMVIRGAGA